MITARNLIETVIALRLYTYTPEAGVYLLYENMPEEGEGVKKKLGRFKSEEELAAFREEYEKELKAHLESVINVKVKSLARRKAKDPPSPKSIRAKLKCTSSPSTSKPPDSIPTNTASSSSEQSTPTSLEPSSQRSSTDESSPST